ncbi:MAG: hypothetical protein AABX86_00580 [Nanoarchaeota archaeon]
MKIWVMFLLFLTACSSAETIEHVVNLDVEQPIIAGDPTILKISLTDAAGNPLPLEIGHERILHLTIISEDFGVFDHIHPEDFSQDIPTMKEIGIYPFFYSFPRAGTYLLGLDYQVAGERYLGRLQASAEGTPEMRFEAKDYSRIQRVDGITVALKGPDRLVAGEPANLVYTFLNEETPIEDLAPYLGAGMHIAVASQDLAHFQHVHGTPLPTGEHVEYEHGEVPQAFGPDVSTTITFPAPGTYYLFGQFHYQGNVHVSRFTVAVGG